MNHPHRLSMPRLALGAVALMASLPASFAAPGSNLLSASRDIPTEIILPDAPDPLESYAASELSDHLLKVLGSRPDRVPASRSSASTTDPANRIFLGRLSNHPPLKKLHDSGFVEARAEEQGYSIRIAPEGEGETWKIALCGADPLGVLYAVRDFTRYHLYETADGPLLEPARFSHAPVITTRYLSESGCNLFSARNDEPDFMRAPSLNGYSRDVVFDKHYFLDWLSHCRVTHLNMVWCNAPAYDKAWNEMTAYAQSRGVQVWRHYCPYRPQHEYPPPHISAEGPTSRKGDCPREPHVRQWYLDRLEEMVTQEPLIAGIVIESPYHDAIYCHCDQCRRTENPYPEKKMLDDFVGLARNLRPDLQIIRVTKNPVPDKETALRIAEDLQSIAEKVDFNVNTTRDRAHRLRWHDLGPEYGTYLRTFRSALKGKDPRNEIDFLYNDFKASASRGVTAHGFCYRFYDGRYGSFRTRDDQVMMEKHPGSIGPLSLALVGDAAFEPNPSPERRLHKIERLENITIPDYPPNATGKLSSLLSSPSPAPSAPGSPAAGPHQIDATEHPRSSKLFRYQYGLADTDSGYTIAAVCADITGDSRREIVYASRQSKKIHLLDATDGSTIWSRKLKGDHQSISAADLDADGRLEILYTTSSPGRLYVLDQAGEVLRSWDSGDWKLGNSPVILDGDGDGVLDGYFGSRNNYLIRLRMSDLELLERRSGWVQCGCYTSALDVDGDGIWDLFAGSGDDKRAKGVLHRYDPASLESRWSFPTDDNASSADPVLVDLDGDGRVEIVKSVDNYKGDAAHDAVAAYTIDGKALWKVDGLSGEDSPNVADLDGDGRPEIVGMTFGSEVYCLGANGEIRWRHDLRPALDNGAKANLAPILCDLDGDSELEILAITNGAYFDGKRTSDKVANGILVALSASGEILDRIDIGAPRHWNNAFVCNIDDDPFLEVVLSGCGFVDVIETRGFGPATEHLQRRRDYRRLNVLPWEYEDTYFTDSTARNNLAPRADNLVLAKTGSSFRDSGSFRTALLEPPAGFHFRRLRLETSTPPGTRLTVNLLSGDGSPILENVSPAQPLHIDRPVRIEFILSTSNPDSTPVLQAYALEFAR